MPFRKSHFQAILASEAVGTWGSSESHFALTATLTKFRDSNSNSSLER